jgi:hypothetical protein
LYITFIAGDFLTARVALLLQYFIDAALIDAERRSDFMLILAIPAAKPDLDGIIDSESVTCVFHAGVLKVNPGWLDRYTTPRIFGVVKGIRKPAKVLRFSTRGRGGNPGLFRAGSSELTNATMIASI